ncbi:MAG: 3-ketoacyl-ACP reductase [SAR324 cluster bacterium]|nr:3-ketoacyl-ACP reductase [SAR324 cluster bacterium]
MTKAALVTGASQGIGRATALALAGLGYDMAINDLKENEKLISLANEIRLLNRRVIKVPCDISELDAHDAMLDTIIEEFGSIDCLVNNAGVSVFSRGDLLEVSPESFNHCLEINTRGTFFLTQKAARRMVSFSPAEDLHRCIVFITSSNAVAASIERGEYCISKAALSMASKLFALRLAGEGIGVYEIQPGLILTDMTAPSKKKYDELIAQGMTAIQRWGTPEDIAEVIRSIAEGRLPYTVGQEIRIDGGLNILRF